MADIPFTIFGGALVAVAASLNLLLKGKITGISGMYYGLVTGSGFISKLGFFTGFIGISSYFFNYRSPKYFESFDTFEGDLSLIGFLVTGFLVGLGTKLGNGCTSGHGVCGIARLSKRSIVATAIFFAVGVGAACYRHVVPIFNSNNFISLSKDLNMKEYHYFIFFGLCLIFIVTNIYHIYKKMYETVLDFCIQTGVGLIFGFGLLISGMVQRTKIENGLNFYSSKWDPALYFFALSAIGFNLFFYQIILKVRKDKPIYANSMELSSKTDIDLSLIFGAIIFGAGWGFSGLCPGPAIMNSFIYLPHMACYMLAFTGGQFSALATAKLLEKLGRASQPTSKIDG